MILRTSWSINLKTLALNEAEAAVKETTKKLNDVLRDKRTALESEQKKAA